MGIITIKKETSTRFSVQADGEQKVTNCQKVWSENDDLFIEKPSGKVVFTSYDQVEVWDIEDAEPTTYESIGDLLTALETLGFVNFNSPGASGSKTLDYAVILTYNPENPSVPNISVKSNDLGAVTWTYFPETASLQGSGNFIDCFWNLPTLLNPVGNSPESALVVKTNTVFGISFLDNAWGLNFPSFENTPIYVHIYKFK